MGIRDWFKSTPDPIQKEEEVLDPRVSYGKTGLSHTENTIDEEWLRVLEGENGIKTFRQMGDQDDVCSSSLLYIYTMLRQAPRFIEKAPIDDPRAEFWAKFAEDALKDMKGSESQAFSQSTRPGMQYGHSFLEKTYKTRQGIVFEKDEDGKDTNKIDEFYSSQYSDNKIGIAALEGRSADSIQEWIFEEDTDKLLGIWQIDCDHMIPIDKLFHWRIEDTEGKDNPKGRSILRSAYRSWRNKTQIENYEGVGVERDLAGIPVFELPAAVFNDASKRAHYEKIGQLIRAGENACVVMPASVKSDGSLTGYKFHTVASSGRPKHDANQIIIRYRAGVSTSILFTAFLYLGTQNVGSHSLHSSETSTTAVAMDSLLDTWTDEFTKQVIWPLMRVNGVPREFWPKMSHGDIEQQDIEKLIKVIVDGINAALITPTPELGNHLLEMAGLPKQEVEDVDEKDILFPDGAATSLDVAPEDKAKTAFTGIQIERLGDIQDRVSFGYIERATGIRNLMSALSMTEEEAEANMGVVISRPPPTDVMKEEKDES